MDWASLVISILEKGADLWLTKEKNKYIDELLELKEKLYEEKKKPIFEEGMDTKGNYMSDSLISDYERRLYDIAQVFASQAGRANT